MAYLYEKIFIPLEFHDGKVNFFADALLHTDLFCNSFEFPLEQTRRHATLDMKRSTGSFYTRKQDNYERGHECSEEGIRNNHAIARRGS